MTYTEPDFDIGLELDSLAKTILKAAMAEKVDLKDRLEAFKICSQHHVNVQKLKKKGDQPAGDSDTPTMGSLRSQVAGASTEDSDG